MKKKKENFCKLSRADCSLFFFICPNPCRHLENSGRTWNSAKEI